MGARRIVFIAALGAASLQAVAALGGHPEAPSAMNRYTASAKAAVSASDSASGAYRTWVTTTADGSVIKEFANHDGVVFAVTWQGPWRPDLKQLLGSYYTTFQQESAQRVSMHARAPSHVFSKQGLFVSTRGHARAFEGLAYVQALLPPGVSPAELHSGAAR